MPEFREIYNQHAETYDLAVSCEDYEGNLLAALNDIRPLNGLDVVEFGAGTGRVTRLLGPVVNRIWSFDLSSHMLGLARARLEQTGMTNWAVAAGDNRAMPVADNVADLAIEGWSFGHFTGWYPETWIEEISKALLEMRRVLRRGGTAILIETLGTGEESPAPPSEKLGEYYTMAQKEFGFAYTWIRTDFRFESVTEAEMAMRFFFGDELGNRVAEEEMIIVPECTGLWWLTL